MKPPAAIVVEAELTKRELTELKCAEQDLARADASFHHAGKALAAIHGGRLYRPQTWAQYCAGWDLSTDRADQLMKAAAAMDRLAKCRQLSALPARESHVRPLLQLAEEDQADAWAAVVAATKGKRPTAADVERVVEDRLGRPADAAPGEVSSATRQALAAMTPEGQRAVVERSQESARTGGRVQDNDNQDARTNQIRRLLTRAEKIARGHDREEVEWAISLALQVLDGREVTAKLKKAAA